MSFRNRLALFFIVIVVVPMVAVALVLFRLVSDSQEGKVDARLGQAQQSGLGLYREAQLGAVRAAEPIGSDQKLATALRRNDIPAARARLERLAEDNAVARVVVRMGDQRVEYGSPDVVAPQRRELTDAQGKSIGQIVVSTTLASDFARLVSRVTELQVLVQGAGIEASTLPGLRVPRLPHRGTVDIGGSDYRITSFSAATLSGERVVVALLAPNDDLRASIGRSSRLVAAALILFLLLALAFAVLVSRSLQAQIQQLLEAAKRLGGGEFGVEVPAGGRDEFAALGAEFNAMARQLEVRLEDLRTERTRLQEAIRRIGESFASNLDRDALLDLVVQTAVDGVGADSGRAMIGEPGRESFGERTRVGHVALDRDALEEVEQVALRTGEPAEIETEGEVHALAHPLRPTNGDHRVLGLISVTRVAKPFSSAERELFHYLAKQAGVSIENVSLHETVQRQAVTDELTGLFNHRRFQEVMANEIERHKRGGQDMSLVLLDIDDFKSVNDTYGHMQGDLVLRHVAKVLRESSREIDEPARYGGEEMAVALPQTDLEGAFRFAERVRKRIESLHLPLLEDDGNGRTLSITASFGAASLTGLPEPNKDALVAAADAALYQAKRTGKNRTVRAG